MIHQPERDLFLDRPAPKIDDRKLVLGAEVPGRLASHRLEKMARYEPLNVGHRGRSAMAGKPSIAPGRWHGLPCRTASIASASPRACGADRIESWSPSTSTTSGSTTARAP